VDASDIQRRIDALGEFIPSEEQKQEKRKIELARILNNLNGA
jgi:ribosomal protein S16